MLEVTVGSTHPWNLAYDEDEDYEDDEEAEEDEEDEDEDDEGEVWQVRQSGA